jgi:hypothetical protein
MGFYLKVFYDGYLVPVDIPNLSFQYLVSLKSIGYGELQKYYIKKARNDFIFKCVFCFCTGNF